MERAWALLAVSSAPQELTLDDQAAWAEKTAAENGWELSRTFRGVSSGRLGTRKLLEDLLKELRATPKADRPKRILMIRLDRLGRGTGLESIAAIADLRKLGCSIYTCDLGQVTIEKVSDVLRPVIDAITAAVEKEKRAEKSLSFHARKKAAGEYGSIAPTVSSSSTSV